MLNENRRVTALKDKLFTEILSSIFRNTANLGTGAILLIAGSALQDGTFTIGDFSLFVYYLWFVTDLTALTGIFFARFRQTGVSLERLDKLMIGAQPQNLVEKTPIFLRGEYPQVEHQSKTDQDRLETFAARNLDLSLSRNRKGHRRDQFGAEAWGFRGGHRPDWIRENHPAARLAGSCCQKMLGRSTGTANVVADPANFFIPPRTAYTSQIPLLFSESLQDNILLGIPESKSDLNGAFQAAVLEG